jgi:hypothetical protein
MGYHLRVTLVIMNFYGTRDSNSEVVYAACSIDCALVGFSSFSSLTL